MACANRSPTLTYCSPQATQVVYALCTKFSSSWNLYAISSTWDFTCTVFFAIISTVYAVMCSCISSPLSKPACSVHSFIVSISVSIFFVASYNCSNWAYLDCFSTCMDLNSVCIFFIYCALFILFDIVMVFCFCFNSCITIFTPSSFWSNSWILSSSWRFVHSFALLL
jgi:hypothetical protein